ncbi:hypothetical protein D6783_00475 [Candidatus Woesearchaeota archaeon]|nr:MAG: hypothetical protein D6783_00475 [Candidatus Woesearchaeota archaeon]
MKKTQRTTTIAATLLLAAMLIISGCTQTQLPTNNKDTKPPSKPSPQPGVERGGTQELKKINNPDELITILKAAQQRQGSGRSYGFLAGPAAFDDVVVGGVGGMAQESRGFGEQKSPPGMPEASTYSQTNVQVEGVDEADIVKNDGKYIYLVREAPFNPRPQGIKETLIEVGQEAAEKIYPTTHIIPSVPEDHFELVIIDAYPADQAKIISKTKLPGRGRGLFLGDERLVVFITERERTIAVSPYSFLPEPTRQDVTKALLYDISNPEKPQLLHEYAIQGNFLEARLVGDYAYFIVQEWASPDYPPLPLFREGDTIVYQPTIYYFDNPEESYTLTTISSLNLNTGRLRGDSFLLGWGATVYATPESLYLAYSRRYVSDWGEDARHEEFFNAVYPLLPSSVQEQIDEVKDRSWLSALTILEDYYNSLDDDELERTLSKIEKALNQYRTERSLKRSSTIIKKFSIEDGEITYQASGEVRGNLLNQFSMDEWQGTLRVATTINYYDYDERTPVQFNSVFILDEDLEEVGSLEGIAEGERIYSARFMGDRLYLVTFKRIDPFFAIDLSNPREPRVLGELKIPGFSQYLHPYDKNYIIGIGMDVDPETNRQGGVKVALFDVTDVSKPKEVDTLEIGETGSSTPILEDHKAFLFDKEKNLLVLPIFEVKGKRYYDENQRRYTQDRFTGAYVLALSPTTGITVRGTIEHEPAKDTYRWRYYSLWRNNGVVQRSIYMDDVLYTISNTAVKMNKLNYGGDDDLDLIGAIDLLE